MRLRLFELQYDDPTDVPRFDVSGLQELCECIGQAATLLANQHPGDFFLVFYKLKEET